MASSSPPLTPEQQASIQYQLQHIHDSRVPESTAVAILFLTLSTTALMMRFWARKVAKVPYQADDWTALAGWITLLALNINFLISVLRFGYGRHLVTLGPENLTHFLKSTYSFQWWYPTTLTLIRTSIILFYLRVFGTSRYRWIFFAVQAYLLAYLVMQYGILLGQCRPIRKHWEPNTPGTCLPFRAHSEATGALVVLGDVLVLIAPIPAIWNMHTSRARKLAVTGIFFLGGMVCIVSFIRMFYTRRILSSFNVTWDGWEGGILTVIEPNVGFVCACLPTVLPLFRKRFRSQAGSKSGPSSSWLRSQLSKMRSGKGAEKSTDSSNSFQLLPGSGERARPTPDPRSVTAGVVVAPAPSRPTPVWTGPEPPVGRPVLGSDHV